MEVTEFFEQYSLAIKPDIYVVISQAQSLIPDTEMTYLSMWTSASFYFSFAGNIHACV